MSRATSAPALGSWPARRARSTPDAVATVHDGNRQTYRELHTRVDALARALRDELGVQRGDRVAYLGPNHPSFLETLFAVTGLGAVFVPLNTRLAAAELDYMIADSGATRLVHGESHAEIVADLCGRRSDLVSAAAGPGGSYEALLARHLDDGEPADEGTSPSLDDDAVVMYTSGTTGRPKGARLTHGNLTWNAVNVVIDVDIASDEVTLVSAPLFHTAALGMTTLPTLLKGGTVLLEPAFDPERTIDLIEGEHVTFAFGVPTMFDAISRSPRWADADLSSLRYLLCGGAPVPLDLVERYGERGLTFMQGYGMTEAAPHVLLLPAEESRRRAGSAGRPAFFTDVTLDTGPDDAARGELLVRGPNVITGYWNGAGADAFDDGWFRSGDVAERDDEGWYRVVDRAKDMFISGGENVYPAEVEDVLLRHPGVDDAAVIGAPDDRWGEVGHALVVRADGHDLDEDAVSNHAAEHLGKYKVPKVVTFVDRLPRNPTGKLDKVALRREHIRSEVTS